MERKGGGSDPLAPILRNIYVNPFPCSHRVRGLRTLGFLSLGWSTFITGTQERARIKNLRDRGTHASG